MNQFFVLSPEQIKIKNYLSNKKFIQIDIFAISDALPNNNGSHFTLSSLYKGLESFNDKPILGFFNREGDFESHNGKVGYDPELDQTYWDNSEGEQILGFIREKDEKAVVEYRGEHWIKTTAIIYTQYNYKQVRKLLRDKKKKVSVEIKILESEVINGVLYIYDFELLGITILGSKNGVAVREGIEGAHLSVMDAIDEEVFNNQKQALVFAYEEYDKSLSTDSSEPENNSQKITEGGKAVENNCSFEELKEKYEQLEKECSQYKNQCAEYESKCTAYEAKCAEYESKCTEYEAKCTAYESKCAEYEAKCMEYEEKCNAYESKCAEYEANMKEVEKNKEENQKNFEQLQFELEKAKNELLSIKYNSLKDYAFSLAEKYNISEEAMQNIYSSCLEGKYSINLDVDKEIAFILYEQNKEKAKKTQSGELPTYNVVEENTYRANKNAETWRERLKQI